MIKYEPLVWYDVNRVSATDLAAAIAARPTWHFLPMLPSRDGQPPIGLIAPVYPSVEDLFHWQPKEPV